MSEPMTALEAKYEAQKIAFGPFFFQAVVALKELGILQAIGRHREGVSISDLVSQLNLPKYGVTVLLEAGLISGVIESIDNRKFKLTKVGVFIKSDKMTNVNLNFAKDVCYKGLAYLSDSVKDGKPLGLAVFGNWDTIYHGLNELPDDIRKSWFEFDHYYSDTSFPHALDILFKDEINTLYDIGGNTGKWAIECCKRDSNIKVTLFDLEGQISSAKENIKEYEFKNRINYHPIDFSVGSPIIPEGADVIWMSQFLDCFSFDQILVILKIVQKAATDDTIIYIMEPYWDEQEYDASKYSIVALTLYFTCLANGSSKMFHSKEMLNLIAQTNLEIMAYYPNIGGTFNSLLKLQKK